MDQWVGEKRTCALDTINYLHVRNSLSALNMVVESVQRKKSLVFGWLNHSDETRLTLWLRLISTLKLPGAAEPAVLSIFKQNTTCCLKGDRHSLTSHMDRAIFNVDEQVH